MQRRTNVIVAAFCITVTGALVVSGSALQERFSSNVKGASTKAPLPPTHAPLISSSPTPTQNPSPTPVVQKPPDHQPTPQKKYGGWYWNTEADSTQRWLGTDDEGSDIWSDTGVIPSTPTPTPKRKNSSHNATVSSHSYGAIVEVIPKLED